MSAQTAARPARPAKQMNAAAAAARSSSSSASSSSHLAMVELKQRILTSLSKLADRDTCQIAVEDLENVIQSLSPETLPMLLNCLYDSCSDPKSAVKKESLRLLSYVCSLHSDSTSTHLPKIIGQIVKRLKDSDSGVRDACRDSIGALSALYLKGEESNAGLGSVVGLFVKPLFEAMAEQNKGLQSGAALCMAKMVDSATNPPVTAFQKLCPRICKLLNSPNFMPNASLLPVISSLSQVGAIAPQSLEALLESIHECLGSTDWSTRKAAAEALSALALHSSSLIKDKAESTLAKLEASRFDKIKPVRDSIMEALQLWKKMAGECGDGTMNGQKLLTAERFGSESGEKRSKLADLMKKEPSDDLSITSDSATKGKAANIPEKAVVILKKKAPALTDKELNPEFFQQLEKRGSVEVIVPRRGKNSTTLNNEEGSEPNNSDSNTMVEQRNNGNELKISTSGDDVVNRREISENPAAVSNAENGGEGSISNSRGSWSAIQRQLLQMERQQANLMNMLQEFIGGSHESMVTLENRVRGLESIVQDMARDLSMSSGRRSNLPSFEGSNRSLGKYNGFPNYPNSKLNGRVLQSDGLMRGRASRSEVTDDWGTVSQYGASRNGQPGSRRSPRAEHENDHLSNNRRAWDKAVGSVRQGEGPSARSVWQASKDEATLEAIRVAGDDGGISRVGRVAAVPEAEAMGDDESGGQERDPIWNSWSNAMHAVRVGDMDSAYAEVLSSGDDLLVVKLMDRTGPVVDQLSNEIANEALNAISQFLLDHSLYDICLSWIQQLVEVVMQDGPDTFGIPLELENEILLNLQEVSSTLDPPEDWEGPPPEQLLMQLASSWDIELQPFDK